MAVASLPFWTSPAGTSAPPGYSSTTAHGHAAMRTLVTTRLGYNPSPHTLQGVESGWAGNEMALPDWPPFPLSTASPTELRHRHPRLGVEAPARQLARHSDARVPKNKGIHHV